MGADMGMDTGMGMDTTRKSTLQDLLVARRTTRTGSDTEVREKARSNSAPARATSPDTVGAGTSGTLASVAVPETIISVVFFLFHISSKSI